MDVQKQEMRAIKEIVDVCVGIPRFSYEMQLNAPRPHGDYCGIRCVSSVNPGYDEQKILDNPEGGYIFKTTGIRILTFHIMFSRDGQEYIDFDNSFYRPDVQAILRKHHFAAMAKGPLDLATLQYETNWEVRKAVKMQFNVIRTQETKNVVDVMVDSVVTGEIQGG